MNDYPCQIPIEVHRRTVERNGFGDEIEVTGEPETVTVFGWFIGGGVEGRADGHVYQVEWDATLYAPASAQIHAGDRVTIPNVGEFTLDGEPANWDNNPWFAPGLVEIRLKKVGDRQ